MIGYLSGNSYNRGFPHYVRKFNAAFLALPAMPGTRLPKASPDTKVVVREITTREHGAFYAVVNTGMAEKKTVTLSLLRAARGEVCLFGIFIGPGFARRITRTRF